MTKFKDVADYPYDFFLRMEVYGGHPAVEISVDEYQNLVRSKRALVSALDIEKKYDIFLTNYEEFEKELVSLSLESIVGRAQSYDDVFESTRRVSHRIANLLSSGRMYIDHSKHDIKSCMKDGEAASAFAKQLQLDHFDGNRYYRFVEAVRNYSQHRSLPVHWIIDNQNAELNGEVKTGFRYTLDIYSDKDILRSDKKFKRTVLDEFDQQIDLKLALREYVSALSEINEAIRSHVRNDLDHAVEDIKSAQNHYESIAGECSEVSLFAVHASEGQLIERVPLNLKWEPSRHRLISTNKKLPVLSKSYVLTSSTGDLAKDL